MLVLLVLAGVAPSAGAAQPELLRLKKSADAMGSTYTVELYGYDRVKMEAAADAALDEARRLDELLSNYQPESEWSQVNRHAAEGPMRISPELFQLFSACLDYSRQSEGAFDITVGPLMKVWGFYKGTGHLPHRAEVAAALARVGYRHVHLDARAGTVWFDRPGVELDPGGIGKGYAVDRMVEVLKQNGVTDRAGGRLRQQHLRHGRAARTAAGLVGGDPRSVEPFETDGGGVPEEYVALHFGQLREVFPGRRPHLRPHHGPADGIPGAGHGVGVGDGAAHHR